MTWVLYAFMSFFLGRILVVALYFCADTLFKSVSEDENLSRFLKAMQVILAQIMVVSTVAFQYMMFRLTKV